MGDAPFYGPRLVRFINSSCWPRFTANICYDLVLMITDLLVLDILLGTNTRVPEEEELITINNDSSEQSRA